MEIDTFIAWAAASAGLGPQWTDQHIKMAMLHLHDEGEITYRDYFSCVLLDPTWLCSTVMGQILSSDTQYQQRRQSFRPSARFTIEQIGEVAEIESHRRRNFVAELLESLRFCVREEDGRYLFPARLLSSAHQTLEERELWTSPRSEDAVYLGRRAACGGMLGDFFTPGLFPRLQLALRKYSLPEGHCKLWRQGLQIEKFGAVARVESVVLNWNSGHPQAIDTCIRAEAADRSEALTNAVRLASEIIECIQRVCKRYAPGMELREPEVISIRALWQIDAGEDRSASRETISIAALEAMQLKGEVYWGEERIDELLGQVAITKRTAAAVDTLEQDKRTQEIELAHIEKQPVLCDYYKLMRMRLRSYFNAVSVLRSGKHGSLAFLRMRLRYLPCSYSQKACFSRTRASCIGRRRSGSGTGSSRRWTCSIFRWLERPSRLASTSLHGRRSRRGTRMHAGSSTCLPIPERSPKQRREP